MAINRRIAWPLVITLALFLASLLGILGFRFFALGSWVTGSKSGSIRVDGRTRTHFAHLPPGYDGQKSMASVIVQGCARGRRDDAVYVKSDIPNKSG